MCKFLVSCIAYTKDAITFIKIDVHERKRGIVMSCKFDSSKNGKQKKLLIN